MMDDIENSGITIPPYPLQNSLTTKLRKLAQENNDSNYTSLWAGQSGTSNKLNKTKELFLELVNQCKEEF
jgi:nitronate monooxygenase